MFQQHSSYLAFESSDLLNPYLDTIDRDIIASRQALQSTVRAMGSMAHNSHQHATLTPSGRYEPLQSALISAAGVPHSTFPSPNNPVFYVQPQAYEQASVPTTTMSGTGYYCPKYQLPQYPQTQPLPGDYVYPAMDQQSLVSYEEYTISEGYHDTCVPLNLPMAYAQQQETVTFPHAFDLTPPSQALLAVPPMDNNTAFSTPDMTSNEQLLEPKTPPHPTASISSFESVHDEDLIGVGLYDEPISVSLWEESSSSVDPILYPDTPVRKSLKLEETLDPSTLMCEMDADGENDDEDELDDQFDKINPDATSTCRDPNVATINPLSDGHLLPVGDAGPYSAHFHWTAAPTATLNNTFATFPGSYQNLYSSY